jgi:hypothetical protein
MEINLNPGQGPGPIEGQAIHRREPAKAADTETFNRSQALQTLANEGPDIRAEKVAHARELFANVKYPPDELLNGIARLLAVNLNKE